MGKITLHSTEVMVQERITEPPVAPLGRIQHWKLSGAGDWIKLTVYLFCYKNFSLSASAEGDIVQVWEVSGVPSTKTWESHCLEWIKI